MRRIVVAPSVLLLVAAGFGCSTSDDAPGATKARSGDGSSPLIAVSDLDGANVPAEFVIDVGVTGGSSAKLVVDGDYVGEADEPPLQFDVSLAPGAHRVRVRAVVGDEEVSTDARFTVVGGIDATGSASAADAPARSTVPAAEATTDEASTATATGADRAPIAGGEVVVDSPDELRVAIEEAQPGDVIVVAVGEYRFDDRLVAEPSGTATSPITLRGSRAAVIRTKNASGDYGLHITGDYWRIEGLTVAHATKGIVLDGSVGTVIDGVEVYDIGDEGVHFRSCSSDGVLRNSFVHDTGRNSPQYGEGVYVGSANSNWSKYECSDPIEGESEGDNTERVLIENNVFEDVTAEGADLKEGTDSGTIRNNVFRRTGTSGQNSADSAIDAKGNNWLIEANVVSETDADWDDDGVARSSEFADGFQSHSVYDGYGTGNVFRANRVEGAIPGFGIGLYPALDNIVTCENVAPGAGEGLAGDNGRPVACDS